jgi:CubicO group peptidase (beta-lactamase class C family)
MGTASTAMNCKLSTAYIILIIAPLFFGCSGPVTEEKKYSPETELKIKEVENNLILSVRIEGEPNQTLKERMNYYHVKGVSIAVIKDYKMEWARGYGWADSAEQRRVTAGTLFQAGSISKSLNGVGVLKMVQDKRLNLYADVNDYLIKWKFLYDSLSKSKKITLANLLSHTAGLSVHGFPGYKKGDSIPTLTQILNGERPANTPAVRSVFEPGLKFQYSGGGTTISQQILEDITGKPYDVLMWENVLKPMGMKNSFYSQPPQGDKQKLLASGYYGDGKEVEGKYHIYPEQAAAGLWTNPTDLAHYIIETQLALQGKSNKVLSQEMTKLELTPYIDDYAALGVFIIKKGGQTYFQHTGVDEGFVSRYYGSMEAGNGVVVMANTDNTDILDEIINGVATVYGWKGFVKLPNGMETVWDIKQDRNGNMWFAAEAGIVRYDGKSFANITSKVKSGPLFSVLEDRKGNFWFGSSGSGVYYYDGKSFQNFTTGDGLFNNYVGRIYEDKKGNIWFSVAQGVSRYDGKSFRNYIINGDTMNEDRTGKTVSDSRGYLPASVIEDKTGRLWFAAQDNTFVYDGTTFTVFTHKGKPFKNVHAIIEDKKGNIWLGGRDGLWRYNGTTLTHFTQKPVRSIIEDKKGNIWIISEVSDAYPPVLALFRYDQKSLNNKKPTVTEITRTSYFMFGLLEANDGSIWFSPPGGPNRYDGKTITDFRNKKTQQ